MDEQIDDAERRIRRKELRLSFLRGEISEEYFRQRLALYPLPDQHERIAVTDRRKVSKFGQWIGRWMKR